MRSFALLASAFVAFALIAGCNSIQQGPNSVPSVSTANRVPPPVTGNRPGEIFNQILPYPCTSSSPCPTNFEVTFRGNVTADIPPNEPLNVHESAFCNPSTYLYCSPTISYNASSNITTITWAGPVLYQNRRQGPGVHFGLIASRNHSASIKQFKNASYWSYPSSPNNPEPIVSVNTKQPLKSSQWRYAIVYVAGSTSPSGQEYATWNAISYVPHASQQPRFTFANFGSKPIYITSSGIVLNVSVPTDPKCLKSPTCPENLKILENLDDLGYPPPGTASSPFVPLTYPPKAILKPHK